MPTNPTARITTIDALRGFALFGILYAHMVMWYAGGPLPEHMYKQDFGVASVIAMATYFIFFMAKFFSIFSFLFGLSFYIQMQSLMKRNEDFVPRFAWRLATLGVIGLLHHTLWRGDILTIYVPLGFLLIFARKLSDRTLLVIGLLLILNVPTHLFELGSILINGKLPFSTAEAMAGGPAYYESMKNAPFLTMALDNLQAFPAKFDYQISSGRLLITFGFFLLGMFVGRMGWFENLENNKPLVKRVWKTSGLVLLGAIGLAVVMGAAGYFAGINVEKSVWAMWTSGLFADVFNACLTLLYISGFTLLMYRDKWSRILSPLASVGKLALTTYVMQTVIALSLFFGVGMGLVGVTTPAINALLAFAIFGGQVVFSILWLKRFNYGPIEWLWRSATYLKAQQMRKPLAPAGLGAT